MIKILRNFEVGLAFWLMIAISVIAVFAASFNGIRTGILLSVLCLLFIIIHLVTNFYRYKKLTELSSDIDKVLHGDEHIDFHKYSEGELAILQNEIWKMTIRLREQEQKLREDKEFLADSLADISHQLRTPLTSMNLIMSLFSRPDTTIEKKSELMHEMNGLLRRVDWLITTLLKMSKLDAGTVKFRKDEVPMEKLLEQACMPVQIPIELREQRLIIKGSGTFKGDIQWTCEAIGNIVKNCMEHTPVGGTITVTGIDNPLYKEIKIKDTGCGIRAEDLPYIFERFYKGNENNKQSFGIGLALARNIVSSQDGTLKACNSPEGGAEFEMRFYNGAV